MFNTYNECVEMIMSRKNKTYGNDNLKKYLQSIGNPHYKLKTIHVAGTNGKGSTTNYLATILMDAGYNVGTFTSPHLVEHRDRIRLNNNNISQEDFLEFANTSFSYWDTYDLSMFDIDFIISVMFFLKNDIDIAIYEVGLGGLLDSTNVITPLASVITNISLDHTQILGDTVEEIASQKAGIIKEGIPLFTSVTQNEVKEVFKTFTDNIHWISSPSYTIENHQLIYKIENDNVNLGKEAVYQVLNSFLAYNVIRYLFPNISMSSIIDSIEQAHWAGRFEEVVENVFVDGAHNPAGIKALVDSFDLLEQPITIVFAALKDKPYQEMIKELLPKVSKIIVTTFTFERVYDLDTIQNNPKIEIEPNYKVAIEKARNSEGSVVISGSLYFISTARRYLQEGER